MSEHPVMGEAALASAGGHLHADHVRFAATFDDLCERARTGDWHELDEVWSGFTAEMERHLRFEEEQLIPMYARESPACRACAARLLADHAEFRRMLDLIGLEIQLKEVRAPTVQEFTALLHRHAEVEDRTLYPWAVRADLMADTTTPGGD